MSTSTGGGPLALFIDVDGRRVVVSGTGDRALAAAERLLSAGAEVQLVGAGASSARERLAADARCSAVDARPEPSHLDGAVLLVRASEDAEEDAGLAEAARGRGMPIVSDASGDARLGSVRSAGPVRIAVSAEGLPSEYESRLAGELAERLPAEHVRFAEVLDGLREKLEARYPDAERRRLIWGQLVDESSPVLALLQAGDEDEALELAERMAWGTG